MRRSSGAAMREHVGAIGAGLHPRRSRVLHRRRRQARQFWWCGWQFREERSSWRGDNRLPQCRYCRFVWLSFFSRDQYRALRGRYWTRQGPYPRRRDEYPAVRDQYRAVRYSYLMARGAIPFPSVWIPLRPGRIPHASGSLPFGVVFIPLRRGKTPQRLVAIPFRPGLIPFGAGKAPWH